MPKLDLAALPRRRGSSYPTPHDERPRDRVVTALAKAGGLTEFGVNLLELPPGTWSSQRHWHTSDDEFVYVLAGEPTLVTDEGEEGLRPGDCVTFPRGEPNAHHLINGTDAMVVCLVVGTDHDEDVCTYPDIDMRIGASNVYEHRDGRPYPRPARAT